MENEKNWREKITYCDASWRITLEPVIKNILSEP